jgi:Transcriptional regulator
MSPGRHPFAQLRPHIRALSPDDSCGTRVVPVDVYKQLFYYLEVSSKPSPELKRQSAPRPREAIFAAATRLFGERGYAGTTTRDIARAVGILPGSLYAHISSKEELLLEIIEGGVDRFVAAVDAIDALGHPPEQALRAAIREHLEIVADSPERSRIIFHQWRFLSESHRARLLHKRDYYENFFTRTVKAGIEDGTFDPSLNPKVTVLGILGALNWTPEWFSPQGPVRAADMADQIADSLFRGALRRG